MREPLETTGSTTGFSYRFRDTTVSSGQRVEGKEAHGGRRAIMACAVRPSTDSLCEFSSDISLVDLISLPKHSGTTCQINQMNYQRLSEAPMEIL